MRKSMARNTVRLCESDKNDGFLVLSDFSVISSMRADLSTSGTSRCRRNRHLLSIVVMPYTPGGM